MKKRLETRDWLECFTTARFGNSGRVMRLDN
jgi:hypothetical protein